MSFTPEPGWASRATESGDAQAQPTPTAPIAADDDAPMWMVAELPAQAPTTRYVPSEDAYSGPDAEAPMWLTASMEKDVPPIEPTLPASQVGAAPQFGAPQQQPTPAAYPPPAYGSPAYPAPAAYPPPAYGSPAYPAPAPASYAPTAYPAPAYGNPAYGNPGYPAPSFVAPKRKRKVWPWVVGGIAALLVVGGIGTVGLTAIMDGLNADQNDAYTGEVISPGDAPTLGDQLVVSESGGVAFDINDEWYPAANIMDMSGLIDTLPPGTALVGTYFTSDPATSGAKVPTLVMVLEILPSVTLASVDIETAHKAFIDSGTAELRAAGIAVTETEAVPLTTSNGLDGLVTDFAIEEQGLAIRAHEYTFARAKRVVFIQVMSYNGAYDDATAQFVLDTLRVDK